MTCTCNPRIQEAEDHEFKASLSYIANPVSKDTPLPKKGKTANMFLFIEC
jgi:hypothetical protein